MHLGQLKIDLVIRVPKFDLSFYPSNAFPSTIGLGKYIFQPCNQIYAWVSIGVTLANRYAFLVFSSMTYRIIADLVAGTRRALSYRSVSRRRGLLAVNNMLTFQ